MRLGSVAKLYYWHGECHTLRRWSQILDIPISTMFRRLERGERNPFSPVLMPRMKNGQLSNEVIVRVKRRRLSKLILDRRSVGMDTIHLEVDLYHLGKMKRHV